MSRKLYDVIFIVIAAVFVFFLSKKPIYNWDMIAYMGVAVEYSEHDLQKVHDSVYHTLQHELPPKIYSGLTADKDQRHQCLTNVSVFGRQLSFFRTKPLYTFLVFSLSRIGVHLVTATLIPSMIACFAMIILAYYWLCVYLKRPYAFLAAIILAVLPVFSELDRYSTPDALSNFFVLLSLYGVATGRSSRWVIISLILATFSRVDNFVLAIVIAYFIYMKGRKNLVLKLGVTGLIAGVCIVGIPVLLGDKANWFTQFAFLFSVKDYIQHWRDVIYILRTDWLYLLLIVLTAFLLWKGNTEVRQMLYIVVATVVIRLFLFPSLQERFFAAYEFVVIIMFLSYLAARYGQLAVNRKSVTAAV